MNFWTPQTGKMGDGWQYMYTATKIRGFKQTHQPARGLILRSVFHYAGGRRAGV